MMYVCVCMCVCERACTCVRASVWVCERESAGVCVSVFAYMQGSKFVVANATMFSHLLPGCSRGSKHLLLP